MIIGHECGNMREKFARLSERALLRQICSSNQRRIPPVCRSFHDLKAGGIAPLNRNIIFQGFLAHQGLEYIVHERVVIVDYNAGTGVSCANLLASGPGVLYAWLLIRVGIFVPWPK